MKRKSEISGCTEELDSLKTAHEKVAESAQNLPRKLTRNSVRRFFPVEKDYAFYENNRK